MTNNFFGLLLAIWPCLSPLSCRRVQLTTRFLHGNVMQRLTYPCGRPNTIFLRLQVEACYWC